jgi:hypothetical protein
MPDMMPPGSHLPPPGVALDPTTNPQNFYVPGMCTAQLANMLDTMSDTEQERFQTFYFKSVR